MSFGQPAAVVSSTALHYPSPTQLADIYRTLARLLPDRGVLINADMFPLSTPVLDTVASAMTRCEPAGEDWEGWWRDVHTDKRLSLPLAARAKTVLPHGGDNALSADAHIALMQAAGFREAGEVWRDGRSAVVVAVR
ncbi:hypothetical protein [Hoyosella altamirensis]|uniref:Methyltransferase n=1 Tax=Hoyosella altamirensis TaxID=616997 RepID=A0A839RSH5_9ACTN|nr:hypothetical protein [Hoyosella altamirensis]MBB3039076.1 hypothetical protein [Hoyosella altamirensis]